VVPVERMIHSPAPETERLIAALADARAGLVIVSSGGGAEAISRLVATPGASQVVLEGAAKEVAASAQLAGYLGV
jgi:hypothetical protein